MSVSLLYVTAASRDKALDLARTLVSERLVACANIMDGAMSVYRWQGVTEEAAEAVMIAKTRTALVEAATARILALHDYECPCVVAVPLAGGNPAFLDWVEAETRPLP